MITTEYPVVQARKLAGLQVKLDSRESWTSGKAVRQAEWRSSLYFINELEPLPFSGKALYLPKNVEM